MLILCLFLGSSRFSTYKVEKFLSYFGWQFLFLVPWNRFYYSLIFKSLKIKTHVMSLRKYLNSRLYKNELKLSKSLVFIAQKDWAQMPNYALQILLRFSFCLIILWMLILPLKLLGAYPTQYTAIFLILWRPVLRGLMIFLW